MSVTTADGQDGVKSTTVPVEFRLAWWAVLVGWVVGNLLYLAVWLRFISARKALGAYASALRVLVARGGQWRFAGGTWRRFRLDVSREAVRE